MNNELYHHGILGQKWGVRRFQNKDGSLTNAGEKRYGNSVANAIKSAGNKARTSASNAVTKIRDKTNAHFDERKYYTRDGKSIKYGVGGMRRINASKEERIARGKTLVKDGSNTGKAILAGLGRDFVAAELGTIMANTALRAHSATGNAGMLFLAKGITTATWGYSIANAVRTYQDISDIHAYKVSKRKG